MTDAERGFGRGSHPAVEAGHPHCRRDGGREDGCRRTGKKRRMPSASVSRRLRKHKLDMKLVEAEYTFDNNKLLFYFTADGRIDFRELVKDLASVFQAPESSFARSVCAMRQRSWAESVSAEERCAATPICPSLRRFPSRWQKSRIFL